MGEPPTELPELQSELDEEDPSLLSEAVFLSQPLVTSGLEDCLQFQRQTSMDVSGQCPVPLSSHPETVVTDADKEVYLHRYLEHKLVRTIEAQAAAFREGVEGVPPLLVGHFWEYLRQSKPAKRAQVLQFAT